MTTLRTALERCLPETEGGLEHFVRSRREAGSSWRRISWELHNATGLEVTEQTIRVWFTTAEQAS